MEAIAIRLEAVAIRLEAIAIGFEVVIYPGPYFHPSPASGGCTQLIRFVPVLKATLGGHSPAQSRFGGHINFAHTSQLRPLLCMRIACLPFPFRAPSECCIFGHVDAEDLCPCMAGISVKVGCF